MAERIGSLIVNIEGIELNAEDNEILAHPLVGGLILFARNYVSRDQLIALCKSIRSARKTPLLIMVDQEGGRVQRFKHEFTQLPPMSTFGRIYDDYPEHACRLTRDCGWLMATELLSVGIDLSLAPVLDLNKGISSVIGERAFHSHPKIVAELAGTYIHGMRDAGMAATGKHFPGHGAVVADSHVNLPIDERSMSEIENNDIIPFASLIKAGMSAIMPAHIIFTKIDQQPAGFSRVWLQDILRKRLGFQGPILSDDINMEAANISADFMDRFAAAREAGCDFVLLCNNRQGVVHVLDNVSSEAHLQGPEKWKLLQGQLPNEKETPQDNYRKQKTREILRNLCATGTTGEI